MLLKQQALEEHGFQMTREFWQGTLFPKDYLVNYLVRKISWLGLVKSFCIQHYSL